MKRILALTAVLCLTASMSSASIFKCWLVPGTVNSSGFYSVQVWGEILPDPAILGEDITDSGFSDFAVTIYSPGTNGATAPRTNTAGTSVITSFTSSPFADWGTKINPSAADYDADGDKDAVELAVGDTDGLDITIGTAGPVLIATETWKNLAGGTVTLTPYLANTSRHWNSDGITRSEFTGYQAVSTTFVLPQSVVKPTITLATPNARINTSAKGGLTAAGVAFTATKTAGDQSASGNIGGVAFTTLPASANLDLTITNGTTSQDITVNASATNAGGTGTASTTVTVLEAPQIVLLVNGVVATPDEVFSGPAFWGHNIVTLSLANSAGYIENASIILPGLGNVGSTWTGDTYDLYGYVTATVSNTGAGLNSDSIGVSFVPEPATLALLAIGAVGTIIRRRK